MAQKQPPQKQPQDPYAVEAKKLASTVQRLRGWVGSDPSRNAELGDALVGLTAYRLLGHAYADAAPEAQEAVVMSGKLLAEQGPIGPYTPVSDAVRYFTAAVHLAAIQAGVGLHTAAGRTLQATSDWQEQLRKHLDLVPGLDPSTAVWALMVQARAAQAAGDVETANALADASLDRLVEGELTTGADSYLPMDVHRLVADQRWAAGVVDQALAHDELARGQYERVVGVRLENPGRLSPGLLARLVEPLFPLQRVLADRLIGAGEFDRGLLVRRGLIDTLRGLTKRLGEAAVGQLAQALDDLAADLRLAGRGDEATLAADESAELAARLTGELAETVRAELGTSAERADRRPGRVEPLAGWPALDDARAFAASTAARANDQSVAEAEAAMLRQAQQRADAERAAAHRGEEERQASAQQELVRRERERQAAELVAAQRAQAERLSAERTAAEQAEAGAREAERRAAEEEAARLETKRRREERIEAHRLEEERLEEERLAAERREDARPGGTVEAPLTDDEAERLELERLAAELAELERAEQAEAERLEQERLAAEQAEAERLELERLERDRLAAEQAEAERLERERLAAEQAEAERLEQERQVAEWLEGERLGRERDEAERADAERLAQEQIEAERLTRELAEVEQGETPTSEPAEAESAEPAPTEPESAEPAPEAPAPEAPAPEAPAPEAPAPDELALAIGEWQAAKGAGERRRTRAANERVVELLRPRAEADPAAYGPQLVDALEQLSSIRLRTGDIFGSRAPSREAKALAKTFGI